MNNLLPSIYLTMFSNRNKKKRRTVHCWIRQQYLWKMEFTLIYNLESCLFREFIVFNMRNMFKICFTKTSLTCISLQWPFHIFSSIFNVNNPIFTIACKFYFIFIRKKKSSLFLSNCLIVIQLLNSYISYCCLLCCFNIMSTVWKTCTQWYELVLIIFFL